HGGGRVVDDDRGCRVVLVGGQRRDVDGGGDVDHGGGGRRGGRLGVGGVHQVDPAECGGTHDGETGDHQQRRVRRGRRRDRSGHRHRLLGHRGAAGYVGLGAA